MNDRLDDGTQKEKIAVSLVKEEVSLQETTHFLPRALTCPSMH